MSNDDLSNIHSASLLSDSHFTERHGSLCIGWFHASRKRLPGFIIITNGGKGLVIISHVVSHMQWTAAGVPGNAGVR